MTHINAYFEEVELAKIELAAAESRMDKAQKRLADKKREIGYEEPASPEADEQDEKSAEKVAVKKGGKK